MSAGSKALDAESMYKLYVSDLLVAHTVPKHMAEIQFKDLQNEQTLLCGTVLMYRSNNSIARFGDSDRLHNTIFATLHDVNKIWDDHQQLEAQKPAGKTAWVSNQASKQALNVGRGLIKNPYTLIIDGNTTEIHKVPFVYFTNCDMENAAEMDGGSPQKDYMKCAYGVTPPLKYQRTQDFSFRHHMEASCGKDDPCRMERQVGQH